MTSMSLRLLLCAAAFSATQLGAQVHEAEPPLDLDRGLVLEQDMKHGVAGFSAPAWLKTNVGQNTFAISLFTTFGGPLQETTIVSQWHEAQGWRLVVTADGAVKFEGRTESKKDPILVSTAPGVIAPDTQHHLVLNVLRDATKPNAGIWVDGVELASGVVPPVDLNPLQRFLKEPQLLAMHVSTTHFRLYHRDLTRSEILALYLSATALEGPAPLHAELPAAGPRYTPDPNETLAVIGGTEAVCVLESGDLEAMLLEAYPLTRFHFRNLAWEGDTVFRQDRPMNFGDLSQQLWRVNAGTVFVMLGRQECLERGAEGLGAFKSAFAMTLDMVQKRTPNVVVVGPLPFESASPPLPDHSPLNAVLKDYSQAMSDEAAKRKMLFCDVFTQVTREGLKGLTRDGVQLQPLGASVVARLCRRELLSLKPGSERDSENPNARLIAALNTKNRLWHNYWRPTNWAFLHGDRTQQPSSRDPVNPQLRFFPAEQEKYLPLIQEAEETAYKILDELPKKLP